MSYLTSCGTSDAPTRIISRILDRCNEMPTGCWEFTGTKDRAGYGQICWSGEGKNHHALTHRAIYTYMVSDIPTGLSLDHLCRNRACVNPYHLDPVTAAENNRRARAFRQTAA